MNDITDILKKLNLDTELIKDWIDIYQSNPQILNFNNIINIKNISDDEWFNLCKYGKLTLLDINIWLSKGNSINKRDNECNSGLLLACRYNHYNNVKLLLDNGADVDYEYKYGNNILMESISGSSNDILKLLIDNCKYINKINYRGDTALMIATDYSNIDIIKYLLIKSADYKIMNFNNENALDIAKKYKHEKIINLLSILKY